MTPAALRVVPLVTDLGVAAGHRVVLLSLEVWDGWTDLRFARIEVGTEGPLPRRVPPVAAWSVTDDRATVYTVDDVVGRGDRAFSKGEARVTPTLDPAARRLSVSVRLTADTEPLTADLDLETP